MDRAVHESDMIVLSMLGVWRNICDEECTILSMWICRVTCAFN